MERLLDDFKAHGHLTEVRRLVEAITQLGDEVGRLKQTVTLQDETIARLHHRLAIEQWERQRRDNEALAEQHRRTS
jgi:hypothetical protein